MTIKEHIASMKENLARLKEKRGILTKVQTFRFQPFSQRQKQILTWWMPESPVKDYDGIIVLSDQVKPSVCLCHLSSGR